MDYNSFKSAVAAAAKAQGIADYELYYESSEDCSISTFRHEINQFSSSLDGGVCFRCIVEGKMGYASTEELSESQAASLVSRAADNARTLESEDKVFLGQGGQTYESHPHTCPEMAPTDLIRKMALKGDELLYAADPMVADGSEAQVVSQKMSVAIMNSNGLDLSYESGAHLFIASSVLSNGTEMATDFSLAAGDLNTMDIGPHRRLSRGLRPRGHGQPAQHLQRHLQRRAGAPRSLPHGRQRGTGGGQPHRDPGG